MKIHKFAIAALLLTINSAVSASLVSVNANWGSVVSGSNVSVNNASTPISISWGEAAAQNGVKSSYNYNVNTSFDIDLTPGFALFNVGSFTHNNGILSNELDGITASVLNIGLSFDLNQQINQLFNIAHLESSESQTCADGNANGIGINSNGCADSVTFTGAGSAATTVIDGTTYTLSLMGFSSNANIFEGTNQFWTVEGQQNLAFLFARLDQVETVSEPYSALMILTGLFAIFARRRIIRNN